MDPVCQELREVTAQMVSLCLMMSGALAEDLKAECWIHLKACSFT